MGPDIAAGAELLYARFSQFLRQKSIRITAASPSLASCLAGRIAHGGLSCFQGAIRAREGQEGDSSFANALFGGLREQPHETTTDTPNCNAHANHC